MLRGNKGEWSEIYALLKIISDKILVAGDSDLKKIENLIFPVIKVLRDGSDGTYEYGYEDDLVIIRGAEEEFRIPITEFKENAISLLSTLRETTDGTFSIPEIEAFISSFNCTSLKAKSSVKSDIRIVIHDRRTGTTPDLGFSIKSQLGGASTLLNAAKTTNFIYKIEGIELTDVELNRINRIDSSRKIMDRMEEIHKMGGYFDFKNTQNATFGNNLILIDSALPVILSHIIRLFFTSTYSKMVDLVNETTHTNPLGFNLACNHPFYSYKIKRFLTDIALGMMPSKVWKGQLDATGGYLIVKEDGEVLCYHIYNRNEFDDYLMNNTKLETAGSTKHDFGKIYREKGELFFKLNLQIRFIK